MVKVGAKAFCKTTVSTGVIVLIDVASGNDLKQAIKIRGKEALSDAKDKAINRLETFAQTGSVRRTNKKSTSKTKKRKTLAKKRKASTSTI